MCCNLLYELQVIFSSLYIRFFISFPSFLKGMKKWECLHFSDTWSNFSRKRDFSRLPKVRLHFKQKKITPTGFLIFLQYEISKLMIFDFPNSVGECCNDTVMHEKMANQTLKLQKWQRFLFILQNHQFADGWYCSLAIFMYCAQVSAIYFAFFLK